MKQTFPKHPKLCSASAGKNFRLQYNLHCINLGLENPI